MIILEQFAEKSFNSSGVHLCSPSVSHRQNHTKLKIHLMLLSVSDISIALQQIYTLAELTGGPYFPPGQVGLELTTLPLQPPSWPASHTRRSLLRSFPPLLAPQVSPSAKLKHGFLKLILLYKQRIWVSRLRQGSGNRWFVFTCQTGYLDRAHNQGRVAGSVLAPNKKATPCCFHVPTLNRNTPTF